MDESARADSKEVAPLPVQDRPSWYERQADALMALVRSAVRLAPAPGGDRYTVHLVVNHERGCLLGGDPLSHGALHQVMCDCAVVVHHHDADGGPLAVGRRHRTWSTAQRRAVTVRDGGRCRWPGCDHTHVDVHHLKEWEHGGPTDVANGILLCPGHHTRIHRGYQAVGTANGRLQFIRPDGIPIGTTGTRPSATTA